MFTFVFSDVVFMQKLSNHILCCFLRLLPIMMHSQVLSSLGVAKEITKGTLPNGVEYYLVQNTSDKGFADYALVRTASLSIEDERKSLCRLPHFTDRKPWQFFSEHGVGYSSYGY